MGIYTETITWKGSRLLEENHLPSFQKEKGMGALPYCMQDLYIRKRQEIECQALVMENKHLKATFLPEYGMRLLSLYDKKQERELLFRNPVLQFANLAIRNAWFAGGIEWNIGRRGHCFTTCAPVFVGSFTTESGEDVVRCYEYERESGLYWSIDFMLGEEDGLLSAYVRICNPGKEDVPLYWWTNIAVPETRGARVFSATDKVIYIQPDSKRMKEGKLPYLDSLPGRDASYPANFDFASEYFFQNTLGEAKLWEAIVYEDGHGFLECSTAKLPYKKLFCWGNHPGGRNWKNYLSEEGQGAYVELQGGMAPTQLDTAVIRGGETLDFVQTFGGLQIFGGLPTEDGVLAGDWILGRDRLSELVAVTVADEFLEKQLERGRRWAEAKPDRMLQMGSGFGWIEALRSGLQAPEGMIFPAESVGQAERIWHGLVRNHRIEDIPIEELPPSYVTDERYGTLLEEACEEGGYLAPLLLGILHVDRGRMQEGMACFERSNHIVRNPLALRNMAVLIGQKEPERAYAYMKEAMELLPRPRREYAQDYIELLVEQERYEEAWEWYGTVWVAYEDGQELSDPGMYIRLALLPAALKLGKLDFLEQLYAAPPNGIREGALSYTQGYFTYQALKEARKKNIPLQEEMVQAYKEENHIPEEVDFR